MPLTWKDRIKVASATTGTGTLTLGAAASGYSTFAAGDDGKLFAYVIEDGTNWETGYGTYTHSGTTFARTSRTDSSTGSAINCSGSENLFVDLVSNIADTANLAAQAITPGGRLTLESGVPISTTDQTAKTNIYYTPYVHNIINLWDGNIWKTITFSEYTLALGTLTSGKPYDVFAYLSSGVLALEMLVWTNDTTRATAVTLQDGRYCKSGDKTRLLLGTFYTTATTTTEDSLNNRYVANVYNRVDREADGSFPTAHTYTTAAVREWNAGTNNIRAQFVVSVDPTIVNIGVDWYGIGSSTTIGYISAGIDNTTTPLTGLLGGGPASDFRAGTSVSTIAAAGKHYVTALEYGTSGTTFQSIGLRTAVSQ